MTLNLARTLRTARGVATALGLTPRVTITRPAPTNGRTGVTTGTALTQRPYAIEMSEEQRAAQPGESWQQARVALLLLASDCAWVPEIGDRVLWGGTTHRIVARSVLQPTGAALTYAIGLAS